MPTDTDLLINMWLLAEVNRISRIFAGVAIKAWDMCGQGNFDDFIAESVEHQWDEFAGWN